MATFLFDKTIFGPVNSRRLGVSLGINLLPNSKKVCTFDCVYCECGSNNSKKSEDMMPTKEDVKRLLHKKLVEMSAEGVLPDVITFAGNGEPTIHQDFAEIIDDTISLRNELAPSARIAVLSNATMLHKPQIINALTKVDDNILKLDSGIENTIRLLNAPNRSFSFVRLVEQLCKFDGNLIIQTLFLKGFIGNDWVDNSTKIELDAWIALLQVINPKKVMIYSIDRETPVKGLQKIDNEGLKKIAEYINTKTKITIDVA